MVSKKKYVSFLHLRTGIVINPCILLQNLNTTYCYNNCIQIVFLLQGKEDKNESEKEPSADYSPPETAERPHAETPSSPRSICSVHSRANSLLPE